jgi:hypothetical protein
MDEKQPIGIVTFDGQRVVGAGREAELPPTAPLKRNRVEPKREIDKETGFEISEDFEPFNAKYEIFNRANWDESVRSEKALEVWQAYVKPPARARKADG